MTLRILGFAALIALFSSAPTKAFANEEGTDAVVASEELSSEALTSEPTARRDNDRDWNRDREWDRRRPRGNFVCYARNIRGRTFAAWGNWRTPARWVQQRALQQCRYQSGVLRFTCRNIGCRR